MNGHYLLAEQFAEAGAEHGDVGTGLVLVVPGLPRRSRASPCSAQVKFGWRRTLRNTALTVCGWAAARRRNGSGPIVSAPRYPRSTSACRLSAARAGPANRSRSLPYSL